MVNGKTNKRRQPGAKRPKLRSGVAKRRPRVNVLRRPTPKLSIRQLVEAHAGANTARYLDYIDGKSMSATLLSPPSSESMMVSRWTTMARTTISTGVGTAQAVGLINPFYFDQVDVVRATTPAACTYAAYSWAPNLAADYPVRPYTAAGDTPMLKIAPSLGAHPSHLIYGNSAGKRRVIGVELTFLPLGTQNDSGGYVSVLHNTNAGALAGLPSASIVSSPYCIRKSTASNRTVRFQFGGHVSGTRFEQPLNFANSDDSALELDHPDLRVFGVGSENYGGTTNFGPDAALGWNLAWVVQSASANSPYEVTVTIHYEGELTISGPGQNSTYKHWTEKPNHLVAANPSGLAIIETASALHAEAQANTGESSSIWSHVGQVIKHVIPIAAHGIASLMAGL